MKKENITEIDEAIADAIAEEEVTREQEKAAIKTQAENDFKEDLRDALREHFKGALKRKDDEKVTIDLQEYLLLKMKEADLDRLLTAILAGAELNYSKDDLRVNGCYVVDALKILYPEAYENILSDLQAEYNEGGE